MSMKIYLQSGLCYEVDKLNGLSAGQRQSVRFTKIA
jgi:hypothetical protein